MSDVLPSSQGTLDAFRTSQKSQHASQDAHLITRGLSELGDTIDQSIMASAGVTAYPAAPGPLATPLELVAVTTAGAEGLIALPEFVDAQFELPAPTVGPLYHGARSLVLSAPPENAGPIYWLQFSEVAPIGGDSAITEVQYVDEPEFGNTGDWTTDAEWSVGGTSALFEVLFTSNASPITSALSQDLTMPAGNYVLDFEIVTFNTVPPGSPEFVTPVVELDIVFEGVVVATVFDPGTYTYPVTTAGNPNLTLLARYSGDMNGSQIEISRASVTTATIPIPRRVGNPLAPGDSIILTGRDLGLTRPIYIVPTIGETADKVIANYLY